MYNRDWLRAQIASYLHDSSVIDHLDNWIDIGAKRVSQVLQCKEMMGELARSQGASDDFIELDTTTRHVLGVQWQDRQGRYINLESVPRHEAMYYKRTGTPSVYTIEQRKIYPLPFADGNYKVQVMQEVIIPSDGQAQVDALTAYPFIFLNAALAEGYDWKQNLEMLARYDNKLGAEVAEVTKNFMNERVGDTPAMRAV